MGKFGPLGKATFAALSIGLTLAMVPQSYAQDAPDITGDWTCIDQGAAFPGGLSGPGYQVDMSVDEQQGPVFNGFVYWTEDREETPEHRIASPAFHREEDGVITFRAPIYGVFALGPGQFAFTESGDPGFHFGRVVDDDTIEFIYLESGENPLAALRLCTRSDDP